jgi:hypothetical protein
MITGRRAFFDFAKASVTGVIIPSTNNFFQVVSLSRFGESFGRVKYLNIPRVIDSLDVCRQYFAIASATLCNPQKWHCDGK